METEIDQRLVGLAFILHSPAEIERCSTVGYDSAGLRQTIRAKK
jgi:hypothetical protein